MTTTRDQAHPELTRATGQTWLVGEGIYLRPIVPDDAACISAWKGSPFPQAPERAREWIEGELTGQSNPYTVATYLVVRRRDERPVGSVTIDLRQFPSHSLSAFIDPLHGAESIRWKAEALTLALRWLSDEQQHPRVAISVPADEPSVIEALENVGARVTARFREKLARPHGGRRDELVVEYLDRDWLARIGDPADIQIPRAGAGEPRPVVPPVLPNADPPSNAMRIGPRVYLRVPQESDGRAMAHWSMREIDSSWDNGRFSLGATGAASWIASWQEPMPQKTFDVAVCLRETDEFIGLVGLLGVNYLHRFGESASMLMNPAYREAGYGSEAKHLMLDYVFNELDIHAIQSWVMFDNPRSAAALRKQGYREAGREHWIAWRGGQFVSFATFDLLASDWRDMPRLEAFEN